MTSPAVAERTPLDGLTAASLSEQLLGFVARSHARVCAALVLVSLACFLPGFASLHPMDRDEPRFAQASKQMLETGDLPVEAVANEVGYEDASFFGRLFRRKVGLTPAQYRIRFSALRRALSRD